MRLASPVALLLLSSAALGAQGWILPRPCPPRPVPMSECRPISPTNIVRTRSDVRVELADGVLRYDVEESFVNRGGGLGEADYLFPLPSGAAFRDLRLS